jgi:hypothetical protein
MRGQGPTRRFLKIEENRIDDLVPAMRPSQISPVLRPPSRPWMEIPRISGCVSIRFRCKESLTGGLTAHIEAQP